MDTILDLLNQSRQSTLFPLCQIAATAGGMVLTLLCAGAVICRDEVNAALRMADISHKEAALTMGISEGLLSRKLSGDKPLTFESLAKLPAIFWQWFAVALAHTHGIPALAGSAARLSRRQARMSLPSTIAKVGAL